MTSNKVINAEQKINKIIKDVHVAQTDYWKEQICILNDKLKKNFMAPFYGWDSTASRLVPLRGGSLLFTTKFPDILGTHFLDLQIMKDWVNRGATQSTMMHWYHSNKFRFAN